MQSFIDLLVDNKLNISGLITHSFDLTSAIEAYDLIVEKNEPIVGAVIEYDVERKIEKQVVLYKKEVKKSIFVKYWAYRCRELCPKRSLAQIER